MTLSGAGMHAVDGTLIIPLPAALSDETLAGLKRSLLKAVYAKALRSVIFDVSAVELLDPVMFKALSDAARMTGVLGAKTVFVGFQPGVVSALIDFDVPCEDLLCAGSLEDGLALARDLREPEAALDDEDAPQEALEPMDEVEAREGLAEAKDGGDGVSTASSL